MHSVVVSIGGSVILSEHGDSNYFQEFISLFKDLSKQKKIFLVVGGGNIARSYIHLGRKLEIVEKKLDLLGIAVTKLNAQLVSFLLPNTNEIIPDTVVEASKMQAPIVVMGGTVPGHSTDLVGAELALQVGAEKFVIATNVDGIFDKDPNKFADAQKISEIAIDDLIKQYGVSWNAAGKNMVVDGPALAMIKKSGIPSVVVNGFYLNEVKKAIEGRSFNGTRILV